MPRPCVPSHTSGPCHAQAAPERRPCSRFRPPRPALEPVQAAHCPGLPFRQLGFRLFSVPGPVWPEMWGEAYRAAGEGAGVEKANRNERPAGRGEGAREEALCSHALFSSPTGLVTNLGHSPTLTSEVTPSPHRVAKGRFNKSEGTRHVRGLGAGGR